MIDLRSDTVTQPTPAMLNAMLNAQVGDDVLGDDPTVLALQEKAAGMFGMEAALFCPSGTMTNQIAIKVHTQPGDEVICHKDSHVYYYEGGGMMRNSGVSVCLLDGDRGLINPNDIEPHINPDDDHRPITRLVSLENTTNRGGGACYSFEDIKSISTSCQKNGLALHLDGARLFNALVESDLTPRDYGQIFDSISICLSKGLGAPVGSLLLGNKSFIRQGKRIRKAWGGAMRQAGYLAAAGIYALENHVDRLKVDNQKAKILEERLGAASYVESVVPVESNIVIVNLRQNLNAMELVNQLAQNELNCIAIGPHQIRMVTHLGITEEVLNRAAQVIDDLLN